MAFITFEGGEGAGKSTLIDKVYERLLSEKRSVMKTREPGGTQAGKMMRDLLLHKHNFPIVKRAELLLFLADRAQHVDEVILPALKQHCIVLCDRYNDSTLAYQGGARGFEEGWVARLCSFACADLEPDLTLYLDIDPTIGLMRVQKMGEGKDRLESEALEFHQKIREAFHRIAKKEPKRFHLIDATLSPEDVFKQAMALIDLLHH